jgi:hypothetical protein
MKIILISKTKKGRDIIHRDGDRFIILEESKNVACFGGLGMLIKPLDDQDTRHIRWIQLPIDKNFRWTVYD